MNNKDLYQQQFDRVIRWHKRLEKLKINNSLADFSNDVYDVIDTIYAFFINCYHLKDWIKNDDAVEISNKKQIIEDFINENECLSICADICNGVKHLKFDRRSPRTGDKPKAKVRVTIDNKAEIHTYFFVDTAYGERDIFELATECVQKWENFIQKLIE